MRNLNIGFVLASALLFAGCVHGLGEEDQKMIEPETETTSSLDLTDEEAWFLSILNSNRHSISIDEARQRAQYAISFLAENETSATRSHPVNRRIREISALTTPKTRSVSDNSYLPDTVVYVCNFEDNQGFSIISADNRIPEPLLAVVGSGSFNPDDSVDNPGFALFLAGAEDYIARSIEEYESKKDSMDAVVTWKIESSLPNGFFDIETSATTHIKTRSTEPGSSYTKHVRVTTLPWETYRQVGPLLPVEWGQSDPYNDIVKYKSNGTAPTGCSATAVAQIIAYWKWPTSYNEQVFDWDEINQYTGKKKHGLQILERHHA